MTTVLRVFILSAVLVIIMILLLFVGSVFGVADTVSISVTVSEAIWTDENGVMQTNASERPLIVTFPATFDGVEYQISTVS